MKLKALLFPYGLRHRLAQLRSAARVRRRFGRLDAAANYPLVQPGCDFDDCSRIYLSRNVRFLRGAVVLAQGGTVRLGENSVVARYAVIQAAGGRIDVGRGVAIGDFCSLYGQGGLHIGHDVLLASGVRIVPNRHTFDLPGVPVARQPDVAAGITIGDRAWLGVNAVVLDGVTIGPDAVVGAGAVVARNVAAGEIVAGVPARRLRFRTGFGRPAASIDPGR